MFSGKSEELIRRLRRASIARQKVAVFKPKIDVRFSEDHIVSHSELKLASRVVKNASEILEQSLEAQVVGVDEAQFFCFLAGKPSFCPEVFFGFSHAHQPWPHLE